MVEMVEIYDITDKAIIQSFRDTKTDSLQRKTIRKLAHQWSEKSDTVISKRIDILAKEPFNYLINMGGAIYKLNPDFEFKFKGEFFPIKSKSIGIPFETRSKHTENLQLAISNWIEYFPEPPISKNSYGFFKDVEKCKQHLLFRDLYNHLPHSGFNVCDRWEQYKKDVRELDAKKDHLLKEIGIGFSDVFKGLELKFVNNSTNLNDYECSLPKLLYDRIVSSST